MTAPAWVVALVAAVPAQAATLSLDRGPIVLGETGPVGVTLRADESAGEVDRPLRLSVNVGTFGPIARTGPGVYRTVYSPPATRFPQMALVAIWRETGPTAPIDFVSFPLYGVTKLPVRVKAGAQVRATVGTEQFGPAIGPASGRATLRLTVPPGVHDARVSVQERSGAVSERTVPIQVPPYDRLTAALVPRAVLADGASWVRLEVYYDGTAGAVAPQDVRVRASRGAAVLERAEAKRFVFRYVPPAGCTDAAIDFQISIGSDPAASARASVKLGLPAPSRLVVRPPAGSLVADGRSTAPVRVLSLDEGGLGVTAPDLTLRANGAPLPAPRWLGDGVYETTFTSPAEFPPGGLVELEAVAPAEGLQASSRFEVRPGRRPGAVVADLSPSPVPADPTTAARLRLEVRDQAGQPLAGAHLLAIASHGSVGPLVDRGGGSYEAPYTPPADLPADEKLRVVGASDGFEQSVDLPLRARPGRLLLGVRAAFSYSFSDLYEPRVGLDAWIPIRAGSHYLALGVSALWGTAGQTVADAASGLSSHSSLDLVPITWKLGYELYAARRLSLWLGAGGVATYVSFTTSATGEVQNQWAFGVQGFLGVTYALGPGQFFGDVAYTASAPVKASSNSTFSADVGGLALEAGYRFALL